VSVLRALILTIGVVVSSLLVAGPTAAEPLPEACGVNLHAPQIGVAVQSLPPAFRWGGNAWDAVPYGGNFDPCATLSAALVTLERATGSSPSHALFFHHGAYLGTATWEPYPFTSLNVARTTGDTVVLDYKDGRDVCTACPGPVHSVRYLWMDGHVEMLDPPPPGT
jgi:hypothetical protein